MDIYIHNSECVMCGIHSKCLSRHHLIPKMLNPKSNVVIGVCKECHRKIHLQILDFNMEGLPISLKLIIRNRKLSRENKELVKHNRKLICRLRENGDEKHEM